MSETPKSPRWALWLPLALLTGFVVLAVVGLLRPASHNVASTMIGKPLPQFALPAAVPDRPGLSKADFTDGKPRLLNIFASWCIPCAVESPQLAQLSAAGAEILATYYCPHDPNTPPACECRKPAPGLYRRAAAEHGLDLARSVYVGDRVRDVEPGVRAGGVGYLIGAEVPPELSSGVGKCYPVRSLAEAVGYVLAEQRPEPVAD